MALEKRLRHILNISYFRQFSSSFSKFFRFFSEGYENSSVSDRELSSDNNITALVGDTALSVSDRELSSDNNEWLPPLILVSSVSDRELSSDNNTP